MSDLYLSSKMFNWQDYIDLSEELLAHNTLKDEALYRTIVGRSYYGIFKQVEDKLVNYKNKIEKLVNKKTQSLHKIYIYFLKFSKNRQIKEFGWNLEILYSNRKRADYDANEKLLVEDAQVSIEIAKKLSHDWRIIRSKILQFLSSV